MSSGERMGKLVTLTMACPAKSLTTEGAWEDRATTTSIRVGVGRGERAHGTLKSLLYGVVAQWGKTSCVGIGGSDRGVNRIMVFAHAGSEELGTRGSRRVVVRELHVRRNGKPSMQVTS